MSTRLPSIVGRLTAAQLGGSVGWIVAVALAVVFAVGHEVDELLDDTMLASSALLSSLLDGAAAGAGARPPGAAEPAQERRFAWQVVAPGARVVLGSAGAPANALQPTPSAGFTERGGWRILGRPLGADGRMLYVAQTLAERREARAEVALYAAAATLAVGLLAAAWLRAALRHELQPLQRLSRRLAVLDPARPDTLPPPERAELAPVHAAIDSLGQRLAARLAHERAFSAHAAHALRTPLAGIDAQLALALHDAPAHTQPRLRRAREAAARLQRVVAALLALFRGDTEVQRTRLALAPLAGRLAPTGLAVDAPAHAWVHADEDLLSAALINLLDNAQRYGATRVTLTWSPPATLRLVDDGPGVDEAQRERLRRSLHVGARAGDGAGLGLRLAHLVALAHGGALTLPPAPRGFAVEMTLPEPPLAPT